MRGLTLIELLVATAVSFVVLATTLLLYTSALERVARRDPAGRQQEAAAVALALIERDVNCAVAVQGVGTQEVFSLTPRGQTDKERFLLKCFTASVPEDRALLRIYDVLKVEYALKHDKGNFHRLIRSVKPFRENTELYEPVSETLCHDVKSIEIEVFNGVSWTNEWRSFVSDPVPAAAAVKLYLAGQDEPVRRWILIPAGIDFKKD